MNPKDGIAEKLKKDFDIIIETAGTKSSLDTALHLAKPGAVIIPFGWHHHEYTFDLENWMVNGWRILNIQPQMNPHFTDLFPRTSVLLANGTINGEKLITHVGPIDKARDIYEIALNRSDNYIKGVLTF